MHFVSDIETHDGKEWFICRYRKAFSNGEQYDQLTANVDVRRVFSLSGRGVIKPGVFLS